MDIADPDTLSVPAKTIPNTSTAITGASNEIVSWTILAAEVPTAGNYLAMIKFTDGGGLVRKTRRYLTVHVKEQIGT